MSIITSAPFWFIIFCLLAGVAYAGALYFRDRFNRTYGSNLAVFLGLLRFISITLLAFFLLYPLVRSISRTLEKPVIVIAQDNSESLRIGSDSSFFSGHYLTELRDLEKQLAEQYDVKTYNFGSEVKEGLDSLQFDEKLTDFSNLLNEIYNKYSGRNLGAVIIASDGLYNKGSNPVYSFKKLNVPIYTVGLGDTTVHRDALLAEVASNRLAYLGNKFPVRIIVEARKSAGETATLTVSKKGSVLHSETITFSNDRFFKTVDLNFDASEIGLQRYTVNISPIGNEITLANNRKDFFVDVLDGRQKVLILAQAPHPDIAALHDAIVSNEGYNVESVLIKNFTGNISDYSLVIFHQLPAIGNSGLDQVKVALAKNIPSLFIWGSNTDFRAFGELKTGFDLKDYRNSFTDVGGVIDEGFNLFELNSEIAGLVKNFPPLSAPFGDLYVSPGATTFIQQKIGQLTTTKPLISFNKAGDTKIGLVLGEGIWRWKLGAFQQTSSHDTFNELITKVAQYLAAKEDRSLFRVSGKTDFPENEAVLFEAELYNETYEPITNREIRMIIRSDEGKEYPYAFSAEAERYRLNVGNLPVGNYTYLATTTGAGGVLKESGEFSVSPLQYEITNTIADHRLLYQLAHDNNGEMVAKDQLSQLQELIKARKEIVSVSYENKELNDLINFRWLLAVLLFLLSLEWLLRKRAGTY